MKAVALIPLKPDSLYLGELPAPSLDDAPDGRGVLVKVLRVGLCGTDREIQAGEYGAFLADEPHHLLNLLDQRLGRLVKKQMRFIEKEHQNGLFRIANFGKFLEQL